jgi:energy-coupling factor transporter ATP-binding protein EcfA2
MAELSFWLVINSKTGLSSGSNISNLGSAAGAAGREKLGEEMNFEEIEIYIRKGFSVIPVGHDKRPLIPWSEFQKRKPLNAELLEWFSQNAANIAIVTGKISNLTVVDCDTLGAIEKFESMLPENFECPIVETPRGGRHYYFDYTPDLYSRNRADDGIDIKSEGGYVLAPPSRTEKGVYAWHSILNLKEIEPPPMPEEIKKFFAQRMTQSYTPPEGKYILDEGNRDNFIFHLALALFKDGLSYEEVKVQALEAARAARPPFPEREALRKVESAWRHFQSKKNGLKFANPAQAQAGHSKQETEEISIELVPLSHFRCENISYLMEGRIPKGMVTLIVGDTTVGKSTLLTEIASRISRGDPLPGSYKGLVRGSTLYITSENDPKTLFKPRVLACGGDPEKIIYFKTMLVKTNEGEEKIRIFNINDLPILERKIKEIPDLQLIVIDPVISYLGEKIDPNSSVDVRRVMDLISEFAERNKITVILVAHLSKALAAKAIHKVAGSHQWVAAARVVLCVVIDQEDPERRLLCPMKSNIMLNPKSLAFRIKEKYFPNPDTDEHEALKSVYVEFEQEEIDYDLEAALATGLSNRSSYSQVEIAVKFLEEVLKNGPRPETEVEELAQKAGISYDTLYNARRKRKIKSQKGSKEQGGKWFLWLPEHWEAYYNAIKFS